MWARSIQKGIKFSNFAENQFITQNLNFDRKQYDHDFKFWEPDPTNQIIRNNIDEGDVLCQR